MSSPRLIIRIAVFTFACHALSFAQKLPREEWGAPMVNVSRAEGKWIIAGKKNKVMLNESDLALSLQAGPATWAMVPSSAKDMLVRSRGEEFHLRLADARKIEIESYDTGFKTGVKISLGEWRSNGLLNKGAEIDLRLFLTVCLEGKDEELVFDIAAAEREAILRQLDWPTALDAREIDHTLLSNGRGNLLPRNWPKEFYPIRTITPEGKVSPTDRSVVQSNVIESWSMSWWGFQKGRSAMMVIVETPNDAAYQFHHPAGGPTVIGPRWRATLGRFGYPRTARMCFVTDGNYVDLAKRYRRYAMDTGLFVSLKEKIARTPSVKELIGTPLTRLSILRNLKPDSSRYDQKNSEKNYSLTTFDERARQLRELKAKGVERLHVVLTGWPYLGYDRRHPDELPPPPQAGGWEGMKRLADALREVGYVFTLHDQFLRPAVRNSRRRHGKSAAGLPRHSFRRLEGRLHSVHAPLGRWDADFSQCSLHAGAFDQKLPVDDGARRQAAGELPGRVRLCATGRRLQSRTSGDAHGRDHRAGALLQLDAQQPWHSWH
jgi:hypothetical protein